jgi:hypothetical protein
LKRIVLDEAYRRIKLNEGDRKISIPMIQAVLRSIALAAAKGQPRAQRHFFELVNEVEEDNRRQHDELVKSAIEYKVSWERELERRAKLGITGPEPLPHPDDIVINLNTGQVHYTGPRTKEEKAALEQLRARKQQCADRIAELKIVLQGRSLSPRQRQTLLKELIEELSKEEELAQII